VIHEVLGMGGRFGGEHLVDGATVDVKAGNAVVRVAKETAGASSVDRSAKEIVLRAEISQTGPMCSRRGVRRGVRSMSTLSDAPSGSWLEGSVQPARERYGPYRNASCS
jgi:hypothetical protein